MEGGHARPRFNASGGTTGRCWRRRPLLCFSSFISAQCLCSPPRHFLFTAAVRIKGEKKRGGIVPPLRLTPPPVTGMNVPNRRNRCSDERRGGERRGRERERMMFVLSTGSRALSQREPPQSFLLPLSLPLSFLPSFLSFDRETLLLLSVSFLLHLLLFLSFSSIEKLSRPKLLFDKKKRSKTGNGTVWGEDFNFDM